MKAFVLCLLFLFVFLAAAEEEQTHKRIIGGTDSNWKDAPWLLQNVCRFPGSTEWVVCGCSSTLITPEWAVTAAHCLNAPYPFYEVGLRRYNDPTIYSFTEIKHPDYYRGPEESKLTTGLYAINRNDIGLQKLTQKVHITKPNQIFPLLSTAIHNSLSLVGKDTLLRGWGVSNNSLVGGPGTPNQFPTYSNILQQIDEVIQKNSDCQEIIDNLLGVPHPFRFNDNLVCGKPRGSGLASQKGLCQGDSGGPLVFRRGIFRVEEMVGLVTDSLSIRFPPTPEGTVFACGNGVDVFTRITDELLRWITRTILFN